MSEYIPLIYGDANTNTLHRGRVSLAHEILSGIPVELIHLDKFYAPGQGVQTDYCNTIACGAGWLALHPAFQAIGLTPRIHEEERQGVEYFVREDVLRGFEALAAVFALDGEAHASRRIRNLFSERTYGSWDEFLLEFLKARQTEPVTDRDLLLARLRYAYQHHCGHAPG